MQSSGDDDRLAGELAGQEVETGLECGQDDDAGGDVVVSGRLSVAPLAAAEDLPKAKAQASIVPPTSPLPCSFALGTLPDVTMLARVIVRLTGYLLY